MPPRSLAALLALAVVLVAAGPVTGLSADRTAGAPETEHAVVTETPGTATPADNDTRRPSTVTMRVQIQPDGNARWRVSATFPFRNENDAAGFDELAADFEADESPLGLDAFIAATDRASAATGREMELRNITRSHSRTNASGTLTVAFTWSNFARTEGSRLYVGDAFNTTDGTWLPWLLEGETLLIAPPEGYGVLSAPQVAIVEGAARWDGPYEFDGREPWIVYSGDAPTPTPGSATGQGPGGETTPGLNGTTTGPGPGGSGGGFLSSALPVVVLVVVAGASAAVLAVYMRRDDRGGLGDTVGGSHGDAGDNGATPDATGDSPDPTGTAVADDASDGGETAAATDDSDDGIDEELLSDEERVERLLDRNGGRMKQANIVKETGWSNAKVSQLLSAMAEDGRVDKLRIGRENLISFPDEDVTDLGDEE